MIAHFPTVDSLADVRALRERHLDGLAKGQDALLEILVRDGRVHQLVVHDELVGYAVVHDGALLEFFVVPERDYLAHLILAQLVEREQLAKALVKTFDHVFLTCALVHSRTGRVAVRGVLVRDYVRRELPVIPRIAYSRRTATLEDLPAILAVDQPIFTNAERLRFVVGRGFVELFERAEKQSGALVGFGLLRPVIEGRPEVEVGIAVDPAYRNKGYAVYMLRDMVEHCLERGLIPVSGSSPSNEPSLRMGTRIGFTARYLLVEVEF